MKRISVIALVIVTLVFQSVIAQSPGEKSYRDDPVLPGGRIGERIRSIISTFNSNDPERISRFLKEECTEEFRGIASMDQHIDFWTSTYTETGGVDMHGIRTYVPAREDQTVVILKDRNYGSWRAVVVSFDETQNHLVDGLRFSRARTPTNIDKSDLSGDSFIDAVEIMVGSLIERQVFSGAVLVARGDQILLSRAGGEASKRFHVPNNTETRFNLGSMNKMFTSTAIVQLAEKGKLAYSDPISKYVDESWLPLEITTTITIHHLLTHTSGLGSYFNETFTNGSRLLFRSVEDFKPLVKGEKPAFEPGERFQYSNTGMLLLGVVIESVTGESYFDYIRNNIYKPAGMDNTDCYEMDYPVDNLAIGYSPDRNSEYGWQNNLYKHVVKGGPAGGGFSTVGDLFRFARAMQQGNLVSKESLDVMWNSPTDEGYGYGFSIEEGPAGKVVGHSGGFDGINGNLDIFLDKGYVVAVLSNIDHGASPLASRIKELLAEVK